MAELTEKEALRYKKMAADHCDFLCEKVFKPAFIMAFLHGAKHMKEEIQGRDDDSET